MKNISYTGVLFGFIASLVMLIVSSFAVVFIFKMIHRLGFVDMAYYEIAMWTYALLTIILSSGLGGYVAAQVSKDSSKNNPFMVGLFLILYHGVLALTNRGGEGTDVYPTSITILSYLLILPSAVIGGYLKNRKLKP